MRFWTLAGAMACLLLLLVTGAEAAQPVPWEMKFQPAATPVMEFITNFHNGLLILISIITLFVMGLLLVVIVRFNAKANPNPSTKTHNTLLEVVWTVVPVIILVVIAVPSFRLLYFMDRAPDADMTVKAIGHQWYWSYEYPDHGNFGFDALMIPDSDLKAGQPRLLTADNAVVVPVNTKVRLLTAAEDVIHAWAIPSFGVKIDAVPGRTNETWFQVTREGTYYGQCSELCGVNHGFMPIQVEVVSKEKFAAWVAEKRRAAGLPDESKPVRLVQASPAN
ncbi:MAG: cytochrome c oxidase subunit II [Alphaproteobacteria bacterium]